MWWSCYQKEFNGIEARKPWLNSSRFRIRDDLGKGMYFEVADAIFRSGRIAMWFRIGDQGGFLVPLIEYQVLDDPSQILKISKDAQWYEPSGCISVGLGKLVDLVAATSRLWFHFRQEADGTFFSLVSDAFANLGSSFDTASPTRTLLGPNCLSRWVFDWLHDTFLIASLHVELKWTEGVEDIISPKTFDGNYRSICPALAHSKTLRSLLEEEDLSQWGSGNSGSTAICLRVSVSTSRFLVSSATWSAEGPPKRDPDGKGYRTGSGRATWSGSAAGNGKNSGNICSCFLAWTKSWAQSSLQESVARMQMFNKL